MLIEAGKTITLAVNLVPTIETRARDAEAIHGRRVLGGTLLGAGLAVAVGAAVYVIATHSDVSKAQKTLDDQLTAEKTPGNACYDGVGAPAGVYDLTGCAGFKSSDQDAVNSAKLKRILGYSAIGLGAVAAGIGGYVLGTAGSARGSAVARTRFDLWASGQGAGLSLNGAF